MFQKKGVQEEAFNLTKPIRGKICLFKKKETATEMNNYETDKIKNENLRFKDSKRYIQKSESHLNMLSLYVK